MNRRTLLLFAIASLVYASITFINHYNFRTYALDLGYYTQVSEAWMSGESPNTAGFEDPSQHALSNHFDLSQILFSPAVSLFGAWGLLLIQWLSILFGGYGLYRWTEHHNSKHSFTLLLCFLGYFSVFQSLAYDYHSTVVACMLIPWYFLAIEKKRILLSWVLIISIALFREDLALFTFFITTGQLILHWKSTQQRKTLLAQSMITGVLFLVIITLIMPAFSDGEAISNLQYPSLQQFTLTCSSLLDILNQLFFQKPEGGISSIKIEFWLAFLFSGGILMFKKPVYLFMLIPVLASKMLHVNPIFWGVGAHYSIAFAILTPLALTVIIGQSEHKAWRVIPLIVLAISFRLMDNPYSIIDRENIRFYQGQHYKRSFEVQEVRDFLNELPANSNVSVSSNIFPHLVGNHQVQLFPLGIEKVNYIVIINEDDSYPLSDNELYEALQSLEADESWTATDHPTGLTVFKRVHP